MVEVRVAYVASEWALKWSCALRLLLPHPSCPLEAHESLRVALTLSIVRILFGESAQVRFLPATSESRPGDNSSAFALLSAGLADLSMPMILTSHRVDAARRAALTYSPVLSISRLQLIHSPTPRPPSLTLHQLFVRGNGLWATLLAAFLLRYLLKNLARQLPITQTRSSGVFRIILYERTRLIIIFSIAFTLSVLTNYLYDIFAERSPVSRPFRDLSALVDSVRGGHHGLLVHDEGLWDFLTLHPAAKSILPATLFSTSTQTILPLLQCRHEHYVLLAPRTADLSAYLNTYTRNALQILSDPHYLLYDVVFARNVGWFLA